MWRSINKTESRRYDDYICAEWYIRLLCWFRDRFLMCFMVILKETPVWCEDENATADMALSICHLIVLESRLLWLWIIVATWKNRKHWRKINKIYTAQSMMKVYSLIDNLIWLVLLVEFLGYCRKYELLFKPSAM